ncbi:MAG: uroporphyrinogen decarboxylase family protein [bacterium]|nr:uroporphyrinogen decarboxylase family protein [bacterium]
MTIRETWNNIMHYGAFNRMPAAHWAGWPETRERWIREGMPADADEHQFLGAVPHWKFVGVNLNLYPSFEEEIYEETEEYKVYRAQDGVVQKAWKGKESIPHYMDFTLKSAADWDNYKRRLQPDAGRIPADIRERIDRAEDSGMFIAIEVTSLMGWIRNWMGLEGMSYLMYDNPEVYADMVDTLANLSCWAIEQVVPRMKTRPDMSFGWEDICGSSGPLVSPAIFKRCVAPGYTKVRNKLEEYGVKLQGIDSDGDIKDLVKPWLEAGVNTFFPIEIGKWGADPMQYRRQYGREMRIIGGFNKGVLEEGPAAIDAEIERRLPLMKDGGYVVMPDHLITPGTSLDNYRYYLRRISELRF